MSVSRLFIEADLAAGVEAPLGEAQAHYLRHVVRRDDGAKLLLFNGRDGEWRASLSLQRFVVWTRRCSAASIWWRLPPMVRYARCST